MKFTYFAILLEIITAIVAFSQLYKFKNSYLKYAVFLICYMALNDSILTLYNIFFKVSYNFIFYNIYFVVNFITLFYLFKKSLKNSLIVKGINVVILIYCLLIPVDVFVLKINYLNQTQVVPYVFGGVVIIFLILNFFLETISSDEIIKIDKKIMFWISIAFFFYYLAFVPFKLSQNFYVNSRPHIYLFQIRIIATVLMNLTLIFGFLWSKKE